MQYRLAAVGMIALAIMIGGCGRSDATFVAERSLTAASAIPQADAAVETPQPLSDKTAAASEPAPTPKPVADEATPATPRSPLADKIVSLATTSTKIPGPKDQLRPTRLLIASLGIDAEIVPVGVEPNGDYEVPPADQVGWYRYGTTPGQAGSAVLAAHIAYDGSDGVFRNLDDLETGAQVLVEFEDGSIIDLSTTAQAQYDKDELPDDLFARTGDPRVVLITCGGEFNRTRSSYEDNVVAFAVPTGA